MVIMSSCYRIFNVKFVILLSLYFNANFAIAHGSGQQVVPSKNGNDSNLIENEDNVYLKSHRRRLSSTIPFMSSSPSVGPSAEPSMITRKVSFSPSELHDGTGEDSTEAPSLSPNLVPMPSSSPSMSSNPSAGSMVPSAEPSMVTGMVSFSPSQLQTNVPTSAFQKNTKDLNDNDDKEEEPSEGNENTSSNGEIILYVVFSAVVAFGLVKVVQYRRRQVLMREREMVMTSPAYNSGHLDELRYVDENEII